jgi:hypothetical protein
VLHVGVVVVVVPVIRMLDGRWDPGDDEDSGLGPGAAWILASLALGSVVAWLGIGLYGSPFAAEAVMAGCSIVGLALTVARLRSRPNRPSGYHLWVASPRPPRPPDED